MPFKENNGNFGDQGKLFTDKRKKAAISVTRWIRGEGRHRQGKQKNDRDDAQAALPSYNDKTVRFADEESDSKKEKVETGVDISESRVTIPEADISESQVTSAEPERRFIDPLKFQASQSAGLRQKPKVETGVDISESQVTSAELERRFIDPLREEFQVSQSAGLRQEPKVETGVDISESRVTFTESEQRFIDPIGEKFQISQSVDRRQKPKVETGVDISESQVTSAELERRFIDPLREEFQVSQSAGLRQEPKVETGVDISESQVSFSDSKVTFPDPGQAFIDPIKEKFRKEQTDFHGNPLFLQKSESADQKQKTVERNKGEQMNESDSKSSKQDFSSESSFGQSQETMVKGGEREHSNFSSNCIKNEERSEQAEAKGKKAKKEKDKEKKKAASKASIVNVLRAKNMQDEESGITGEVSGDLVADGTGNFLKSITEKAHNLFEKIVILMLAVVSLLLAIIIPVVSIVAGNESISVWGDEYDLEMEGDGYVYYSLSPIDIDDIIDSLYITYNSPELGLSDMGYVQEQILRYALSKVGCAYDQDYHDSLTEDIFDCSSLAYRAYESVGIDLSFAGLYTAAEECRAMDLKEKTIPNGEKLIPGDLIFYGGVDNQRYKGIYHVGIYVGNGKMVEARGTSYGVVYGDVRTDHVVGIARPYGGETGLIVSLSFLLEMDFLDNLLPLPLVSFITIISKIVCFKSNTFQLEITYT